MNHEMCLAPGIEHNWEWVVAAFGSQVYRCNLCQLTEDVLEDSNP